MKHIKLFEQFVNEALPKGVIRDLKPVEQLSESVVNEATDPKYQEIKDIKYDISLLKKTKSANLRSEYNNLIKKGQDLLKVLSDKLNKEEIEESLDEAKEFDVNGLPKGAIVTFKDGETWMVTKIIGNSSNPRGYMMVPHGKTKDNYVSMHVEFSIEELQDEIVSVS